jgi:BlaI family transcriptional regulator, penicillinase repressor
MSRPLTELQLSILTVLWRQGEATVIEVHEALRRERRIAQSTVATLLTRLHERGLVTHREEGRQYVYRATVSAEEVQRSVVREFAERTSQLFSGDVAGLVSHLLSARDVAPEELAEVRALIERAERRHLSEEEER